MFAFRILNGTARKYQKAKAKREVFKVRQHKTNKIVKIITSVLLGLFCSSLVFFNSNTHALDYSSNTNVQFTFNPTLSVSVSDNLIIDELMPGTYSDSNIVDVSVSTNNVAGYSLSATVGTNSTNNRLVHASDSNTYFSSLSSNISDLSSFSDNTWGYSYSTDSGSTWISGSVGSTAVGYNGLPLDTNTDSSQRGNGGITLINSTSPADSQNIKFKIGAKAGNNQVAGTYTNTINFYAITKIPPISISDAFAAAGKSQYNGYYKMQDMTAGICNFVQTLDEDSQMQLIDIRDNKLYWVAKLKDGNCWMTQNLDLNLDSTVALTSNDTDLNEYNANGYVDGYTCSNSSTTTGCTVDGEIIKWTPERNTIDAITTESTSLATIPGWENQQQDPYSVDPGDWYWKGTYYNSGNNCPSTDTTNPTYIACDYISKRTEDNNGTSVTNNWATYFSTTPYSNINGTHGHVGNYYNWSSSIASNNATAYAASTLENTTNNPKNSICPAGWRLPVITSFTSSSPYSAGNNEFYNLAYYYGVPGRGSDQKLIESPLYFTRAGGVWSSYLRYAGYNGHYWSSTVASSTTAYDLNFGSGWLNPQYELNRLFGKSVRCVAKNKIKTISDLNYMQDFANLSSDELTAVKNSMTEGTAYTLKDKRDDNSYTVKKINGEVWMTQNLRYLGDTGSSSGTMTIGNNNSNVENKSITLYSLNSSNAGNFNPYSGHCDSTNGYNYACVYDSGNETTGVWYNYAAATAGTITGASNTTTAAQDICPSGWHLPTGPNATVGTDFNKLVGNTTSDWQITDSLIAFGSAYGGNYDNGSLSYTKYGYWWSATANNDAHRYRLIYNDNNSQFGGNSNGYRYLGIFVRCVMSN